ncbi:hypothetical protein GTW51_20835 [Aurantimonas aggregata]|uniref:Uncharacterized protein n=1 Tax=Aurantimonas aggregata TaxID=2047720 RepID=A0A6L9MMZ4_9HYPH|nr:hypothetical protein [Aurantimonas aggregata]
MPCCPSLCWRDGRTQRVVRDRITKDADDELGRYGLGNGLWLAFGLLVLALLVLGMAALIKHLRK